MTPAEKKAVEIIREHLNNKWDWNDDMIIAFNKALYDMLIKSWNAAIDAAADEKDKDVTTCGEAKKCGCCGPCGNETFYISQQSILKLKHNEK